MHCSEREEMASLYFVDPERITEHRGSWSAVGMLVTMVKRSGHGMLVRSCQDSFHIETGKGTGVSKKGAQWRSGGWFST